VGSVDGVDVLEPPIDLDVVPYAVVVFLDDPARRDRLQQHLVRNRVYPAVLWPIAEDSELPELPTSALDISRRILVLHCDGRYARDDLEQVARVLREGLTL